MTSYNRSAVIGVKSDLSVLELKSSSNIAILSNPVGQVLQVTNTTSWLNYNVSENDKCLKSLQMCHHSFGVSFWLFVSSVTDCVMVDTITDGTTGMIVNIEEK